MAPMFIWMSIIVQINGSGSETTESVFTAAPWYLQVDDTAPTCRAVCYLLHLLLSHYSLHVYQNETEVCLFESSQHFSLKFYVSLTLRGVSGVFLDVD